MALTDNILAYWKLDDGSGTSATDATGNGNTGTLGSSLSWVAGLINDGLSFPGTSGNFMSVPSTAALTTGSGPFSYQAWIKTTVTVPKGIFGSGSGTSTGMVILAINTTGSGFSAQNGTLAFFNGTVWLTNALGAGAISDGQWHHFVATSSGTSSKIYWDGALVATSASTPNISASQPIGIGFDAIHGSTLPFNGIIDEVAIWGRALTSTEVSQLYNSGAGLQYPFAGGGNIFNVTTAELMNFVDVNSATAILNDNVVENLNLSDAETSNGVFNTSVVEMMNMADTDTSGGATFPVSTVEAMDLADDENATAVMWASVAENLNLSDLDNATANTNVDVIEQMNLQDFSNAILNPTSGTSSNRRFMVDVGLPPIVDN